MTQIKKYNVNYM